MRDGLIGNADQTIVFEVVEHFQFEVGDAPDAGQHGDANPSAGDGEQRH